MPQKLGATKKIFEFQCFVNLFVIGLTVPQPGLLKGGPPAMGQSAIQPIPLGQNPHGMHDDLGWVVVRRAFL